MYTCTDIVVGTSFRICRQRKHHNTNMDPRLQRMQKSVLGSKRQARRSTPHKPQQTPCCLEMSNSANTPSQYAPPPRKDTVPFLFEVQTLCQITCRTKRLFKFSPNALSNLWIREPRIECANYDIPALGELMNLHSLALHPKHTMGSRHSDPAI